MADRGFDVNSLPIALALFLLLACPVPQAAAVAPVHGWRMQADPGWNRAQGGWRLEHVEGRNSLVTPAADVSPAARGPVPDASMEQHISALEHEDSVLGAQRRWLLTLVAGGLLLLLGITLFLLRQRRDNRRLALINAELQKTRRDQQAILEALPDALFETGRDGYCHDYRSVRRDGRYHDARNLNDYLPRATAETCMAALREAEATGRSVGARIQRPLPSGRAWFELSVARKRVPPGEPPRFVVLSRNITASKLAEDRLDASEQAFRALVEHSPDAIVRYDLSCRRVYVNPAMLRLIGHSEAELLGRTPAGGYSPVVDVNRYMERIRQAATTGREQSHDDVAYRTSSGDIRWHHLRIVPELGVDGAVSSVLAIARDIHELKENELRFRTLSENLPDFLVRFDHECRFIYVNPVVERAFQMPAGSIIGKRQAELDQQGPEGQSRALEECIRKAFATGEANEYEARWQTAGGTEIFEIRHVPERDTSGRIVSVLGIAHNITRLRLAEQALRTSEREFRTLAENAPDVIIRYDLECRRVYVNPAYEEKASMQRESVSNVAVGELWGAGMSMSAEVYEAYLQTVMETGEPADIVLGVGGDEAGTGEAGNQSYYSLHIVAERDAQGQVSGALAVGHDITDLTRAKQRLEESQRQLREMSALRDRARDEERNSIAHEVHDELGQVLTAMKLGISTLRMVPGGDAPALGERIAKLLELSDRSIQVVRDVAYRLRPAALEVGVVPALEWLGEEFTRSSGIPCHLEAQDGKPPLSEEQAMVLFRVVQEGLTNVARHAGAQRVDIRLSWVDSQCRLQLSDDGRGFDPEAVGRKSFGLLGIRERARRIGGEVVISSASGRGSRIDLKLPCGDLESLPSDTSERGHP
jgi:PAS domain S-box-containing protein